VIQAQGKAIEDRFSPRTSLENVNKSIPHVILNLCLLAGIIIKFYISVRRILSKVLARAKQGFKSHLATTSATRQPEAKQITVTLMGL
jgi:hypothetical protein